MSQPKDVADAVEALRRHQSREERINRAFERNKLFRTAIQTAIDELQEGMSVPESSFPHVLPLQVKKALFTLQTAIK